MKTVIIGAGKLGYKLAEALINGNNDIVVVDTNSKVLDRITQHLDVLTVKGNGAQIEILQELNMEECDLVIAVTSSDETNMLICSTAKMLGCKKTFSRIRNPEYTEEINFIKKQMSIDHVLNPELETANEIIRCLLKRHDLYTEDFAEGKVSMVGFNVSSLSNLIGTKIMDLKDMDGLLIAAISRNGKIIIPNGANKIQENDTIYIIGKTQIINHLPNNKELFNPTQNLKRVMIMGGGKIGYYLAKKLVNFGISVKIIEENFNHCEYLSEKLDNALIIHGDGTDINLLEDENIESMDAFIGVTGYDEQNLMMTLLAKQFGVKKAIAKVSRESYVSIIEKLGIDIALNPVNLTASDVLKSIRGSRFVSVSLLLRGQAEVTELIASNDMKIVNKPIMELGLSKGIIIGSIVRDGNVIIPNGTPVILPNDRLIIFSLLSETSCLEKLTVDKKGGQTK